MTVSNALTQSSKPKPPTPPDAGQARHLARCCIVQSLYQWHFTQDSVDKMIAEQREQSSYRSIDHKYFKNVLRGTIEQIVAVDDLLAPHLDRSQDELNPVELAIMRMAAYELQYCNKVPFRVVINEALELTKAFGAEQGHKYVNAILDAVAAKLQKELKPSP